MAELLIGRPLFPGADRESTESDFFSHFCGRWDDSSFSDCFVDISQLNHILDLVGTPSETLLAKIESVDVSGVVAGIRHCLIAVLKLFPHNFFSLSPGTKLHPKFAPRGPEEFQGCLSACQR